MTHTNSTVIKLDNVSFSYPEGDRRTILNISNWQVNQSEHVFVHGPSGSGKSTLLNLLSGILLPDIGNVSINDQILNQLSSKQRDTFRANHIGYVFQRFNLIPYLNSIENIHLARHLADRSNQSMNDEEVKRLLEKLNIKQHEWLKPVSKLSMGQQQRIAIARAMVNKPKLLIADEPTSSLDEHNRDTFMSILMEMANQNGITLLFVSHDLSLKHYFDRAEAISNFNQAGV